MTSQFTPIKISDILPFAAVSGVLLALSYGMYNTHKRYHTERDSLTETLQRTCGISHNLTLSTSYPQGFHVGLCQDANQNTTALCQTSTKAAIPCVGLDSEAVKRLLTAQFHKHQPNVFCYDTLCKERNPCTGESVHLRNATLDGVICLPEHTSQIRLDMNALIFSAHETLREDGRR
jgi:hypothetical protein